MIATALSSMSGGGSSIIALPIFLSMGISFPMATSMQKVSAAFWVLISAYNYLKGKRIEWSFLITFSLIGLLGAYFGLFIILNINQDLLKRIVGGFILFLVLYIYFKKNIGIEEQEVHSKFKRFIGYFFALPMGFYESLLGSGNGIAFAAVSFYSKGFDFIKALGYYFAIAFLWVSFAAVFLIQKGYFSWTLVVPAVFGSFVGAYVGSKFAKFKGNKFVKLLFVFVGILLGLKLIIGF